MRMPRPLLAGAAACLAAAVAAGCSAKAERQATVTGNVLENGRPIKLSETGNVQLLFVPFNDPYTGYYAEVGRDGAYRAEKVPVGKYRISIQIQDPHPQVDRLKGKFGEENSPIVREVTGDASIDFDVAKPQG